MSFPIREKPDGLIFNIRVQPRASKNQIVGVYGDAIKINLTAPPVENAANKACCTFLADRLSVAKSSVSIVSGQKGRNKRVKIDCGPKGELRDSIRETILSWTHE